MKWSKPVEVVRRQLRDMAGVVRFSAARNGAIRVPDSILAQVEAEVEMSDKRDSLDCRSKALLAIEELKRTRRRTYIYFVRSVGLIKIGYTSNVARRLMDLKNMSASPVHLVVALTGGRELERRLHFALRQFRKHGEWFTFTPEIHELTEAIKSRGLDRCR